MGKPHIGVVLVIANSVFQIIDGLDGSLLSHPCREVKQPTSRLSNCKQLTVQQKSGC